MESLCIVNVSFSHLLNIFSSSLLLKCELKPCMFDAQLKFSFRKSDNGVSVHVTFGQISANMSWSSDRH